MQLCYYTHASVEELNNAIEDRIEWYYGEVHEGAPTIQTVFRPLRETGIAYESFASQLQVSAKRPSEEDAENAMIVYGALSGLTPHQAAEERLWTYLTHQEGASYVAHRWLRNRPRPGNQMDAVKRVRNHFFVNGNRGLIRDNGLSRLWWMARIAHHADPDEPLRFLKILLYLQDVRSALIERPSTSMNYRVLRAIYAVMRKNFEEEEKSLFSRSRFREWMKNLNRRGGVLLLDAMPDEALERLMRDEAERALQTVP